MLLIVTFLLPIVGGALTLKMKTEEKKRRAVYIALTLLTDLLLGIALFAGGSITVAHFAENVNLTFSLDGLGRVAAVVTACLYTFVSFYAYEYMQMEERPEVFFAFFFISFGALIAVAMSANLITMYLSFEALTLTTVPLVLHERTKEAVSAGLKYLFYSIGGALMGLLAVFYVYFCTSGDATFLMGGFVDAAKVSANRTAFLVIVLIGIIGFGTKAGMYPMHGWLPAAHPIAPAPASSLLSGIVAKAGVVCVIRLVYYSVGADLIRGTFVQYAWMGLAMLTICMGSMMAFCEKVTKKRLAYSTVSQISYIMLGLAFLSPDGLKGGLLHLMQHAASKGCLFLVAGVFIYKLGYRRVDELKGIGKRMPITMWCFTIASLSLIGIPPLGGFVSKWAIASAALDGGVRYLSVLAPVVLIISALLTAGYLLPVTVDAFFPARGEETEKHGKEGSRGGGKARAEDDGSAEPSPLMTVPMILLCVGTLMVGLFGTAILGAAGF